MCASWCASSPTLGASLVPPGRGAIAISGGVNVLLPTLGLSGVAGVTRRFDLGVRYDTHAGLAHVLGLTGRVRILRPLAASLDLAYGLFAIEEISGIPLARAPFGNGLFLQPALHLSRLSRGGVHLSFSLGVTLRVVKVVGGTGAMPAQDRAGDFTLQEASLQAAAEWERRGGALFLRFRATVPIQADFRVLGYLPWLTVGRTFGLP